MLCGVQKICYSASHMCIRTCLKGLSAVLLVLVVSAGMTFLYQPAAVSFPRPTQPDAAIPSALSDFDGDGFPDPATASTGDVRPAIELQLSRTNAHMVLPFSPTAAAVGSLAAQDIDRDGDTDLLWRGALPPYQVIMWLNDGAGRFECLCPLESQGHKVILSGSRMSAAQSPTPDRITSPERLPSPGHVLAATWEIYTPVLSWRLRPAPVRGLFAPPHPLTIRGPPLVRC